MLNNNSEHTKFALTTIDNPWNPFKEFKQWFMEDIRLGHNTSSYLARLTNTSEALSENENNDIIESAIDSIVLNDPLGIYIKVVNPDYKHSYE